MKRRWVNRIMILATLGAVIISLLPLFLIIFHIVVEGASVLNLDFFTHLPAPVGESGGGFGNAIIGTLTLVGISLFISLPFGLVCGIYLAEFGQRKKIADVVRFASEILNGTPSIVIGVFAYTLIVLPMGHFSALSGGVALGIIAIPIILRTTETMMTMIPSSLKEGGLALGIPYWRTLISIVLKTARSGILTGVLLALARVAGETAPLLFTALGNHYWNSSLVEPIAALPLQIFTYAVSPFEEWHRQAWAGALVLIAMVLVMNLVARFFVKNSLLKGR